MRTYYLEREQWVRAPLEKVFNFFSRPENLQKLTPPWLDFRIVEAPVELAAGALIRYRLRWHFLPIHWSTEIADWSPHNSLLTVHFPARMPSGITSTLLNRIRAAPPCMIASPMRCRWDPADPSPTGFG